MTDTSWNIETDTSGTIEVPGAVGDSYPTFTAGEEVTITFFTDGIADEEFDVLHDFVRYTNENTSHASIDIRGKPWYHETIHPQSEFTSLLVRLEPGDGLAEVGSWWCVIKEASLITNAVGRNRQIEFGVFVVGEYSDYSERKYVEAEFEAEL